MTPSSVGTQSACPARPLMIAGIPGPLDQPLPSALAASGLEINGTAVGRCHSYRSEGRIVSFHDELLASSEPHWMIRHAGRSPTVPPTLRKKANAILADHSSADDHWGLADPRATYCLDFWDELAPNAHWIFTFSRPALFAWSLIARRELDFLAGNPIRQATAAFGIWRSLGRRISGFAASRPERCLCLRTPEDLDEPGAGIVAAALSSWGYEVDQIDLAGSFKPHLLITLAPAWISRLEKLSPKTRKIWRSLLRVKAQLEALHPPELPAAPASRPSARGVQQKICIAGWDRAEYSQTFIRAHIEELPAKPVLLLRDPHHRKRFVTENEFRVGSLLDRTLIALSDEFGIRRDAFQSRPLRRFLRDEAVVAVLAEFGPNGVRLAGACTGAKVPLVVHFHGFDVYRKNTLEDYGDGYRTMFETASAVVAVSSDMQRRLIRMGAPSEKVHCNPCGVEVSKFEQAQPSQAPPQFLAVGRFVNKKGPLLTILAFRAALKEAPDSRLVMVGDGALLDSSRRLASGLGLEERISFLGSRPHEEVACLMRESRAFVQHSVVARDGDSEGTPVAVLEAGASGLPVIGTSHAGIADAVLHDETGFLVEEGDVEAMASYISRVARDPHLAAAVGQRARQHISKSYSMDAHIARLWRIIEGAIEGFRP